MNKRQALKELARRKARNDFWSFCLFMGFDFFSSREEILKPIANSLNRAWYSETGYKIAISTPPRTAKSTIINYFIAWSLGKDLNRSIIRASYSGDLSKELNQGARQLIETNKFKLLFGEFETVEDTQTKIRFKGSYRASLFASSVGGTTTGFGGNIIISDDLYKDHNEALSETVNNKTINWYYSAFRSRLDGKRQIEIVIGTRWRVGELVDVLEKENYFDEVIKIKALTDNNKSFCEEVIETDKLLELQRLMHISLFNSMYQQEPMLAKDSLISPTDLEFIEYGDYKVTTRYILIDNKTTGKDCFSIPVMAVADKGLVIEDVIYTDSILDDNLEDRLVNFINYYNPLYVFIETNQDYSLFRNLKKKVNSTVRGFKSKENKETKILKASRYIKQLKFVRTEDREYTKFLHDIYRYDTGVKNQLDDGLDSLAMLVNKTIKRKEVKEWLL